MDLRLALFGLFALASTPRVQAQGFSFIEVTATSGIDVAVGGIAPGIAVGDFDGDGWEDICVTGAATTQPQFFHNRANWLAAHGTGPLFKNVTNSVFPVGANEATASVFADIDNDGDADLIMSRRFPDPNSGQISSKHTGIEFYINQDVGRTFVALGASPDLGRDLTPHGGLTLGDPDLDGDLDVIFTHNGGGNGIGGPGFFLRNLGGNSFIDDTPLFGADITTPTRYFSTTLCDFNGDLWPDMHASVDFYTDVHCRNLGNAVFQNVSAQVGTTNLGADMGLTVGDPDMDGDFDIYSTNINVGVFYENDGNGNFTNTAGSHGIAAFNQGFNTCVGWGTAFADFDLDMDEDLVVVGSLGLGEFFENDGTGHFTRASNGSGIQLIGRTLVPFDYDHDGDLDLAIGHDSPNSTPRLWENATANTANRHWLVIDPRGTQSNRDGVGCHVSVTAGNVTQHRMIIIGSSFKSGLPLTAHFGLGEHTIADKVTVRWPSGVVSVLMNVQADQRIQVAE